MPKIIDVDAERVEGSVVYLIGGHYWLAPEPDMDTLRDIVMLDVQAMTAASDAVRRAREAAAAGAEQAHDLADAAGEGTLAGVNSMVPQLQRLLFLCNSEGQYIRGDYIREGEALPGAHEHVDAGGQEPPVAPRGGTVIEYEQCDEGLRMPIPEPYIMRHLSGKRAGTILSQVLGEELGRV